MGDTQKSANGAEETRSSESGSGFQERKSGTDTTVEDGTTGDHPRPDSPEVAGSTTRATSITADMSSNSSEACGTDSKAESGSNTERRSHSSQVSQEDQESADLSTS